MVTPNFQQPDGNPQPEVTKVTYADSGVDITAGDMAVELMKEAVAGTYSASVLTGSGGFAGMIDASVLKEYRRPLLASSTDGVGTKVAIAQALDIHDTIGQDLVAMVVDDIVVVGAKPILMTDYIACGRVEPQRIADIVRGIAEGCKLARVPLVGGETAEHPGLMEPDEYDVAGAATGVVEADQMLGAHRVEAGDVLIGIPASGLHSNGFSLVRKVIEVADWSLDRHVDEFGRTLGEELLEPTRIYTGVCLDLMERLGTGPDGLHALSHITGGGLGANLSRIVPEGMACVVCRSTWQIPPVFDVIRRLGNVPWQDLEATLNLGVGMVAVVGQTRADEALRILREAGLEGWVLGAVTTEMDDSEAAVDLTITRVQGAKGVKGGSAVLHGDYRV